MPRDCNFTGCSLSSLSFLCSPEQLLGTWCHWAWPGAFWHSWLCSQLIWAWELPSGTLVEHATDLLMECYWSLLITTACQWCIEITAWSLGAILLLWSVHRNIIYSCILMHLHVCIQLTLLIHFVCNCYCSHVPWCLILTLTLMLIMVPLTVMVLSPQPCLCIMHLLLRTHT